MPNQRRRRFGFANDQFYFKSQAEMNELFSDVPESVDNTNEIVDKITPPKLARDILLPNFPLPPQFANADEFLRELTYVGAFGLSHPLAKKIGSWPSVLAVSALTAAASYAAADRRAPR